MKLNASGQLEFCEAKRTGSPFSPNRKWQQVVVFSKTRAWPLWHFEQFLYQLLIWCLLQHTKKFLTDKVYKEKFPENIPMDVQNFVEKPKLYIFGKSGMYIFIHSSIWLQGYCILHTIIERTQVSYCFRYLINIVFNCCK